MKNDEHEGTYEFDSSTDPITLTYFEQWTNDLMISLCDLHTTEHLACYLNLNQTATIAWEIQNVKRTLSHCFTNGGILIPFI